MLDTGMLCAKDTGYYTLCKYIDILYIIVCTIYHKCGRIDTLRYVYPAGWAQRGRGWVAVAMVPIPRPQTILTYFAKFSITQHLPNWIN